MTMQVSGLFVYPVKAFAGISLDSVKLFEKGIEYDRRWMLIDDQGRFLCQRRKPQLSLFKTSLTATSLQVSLEQDSIELPLDVERYHMSSDVQVWDDTFPALIAPQAINDWFSKKTGISCRMAYQGRGKVRKTDAKYGTPVSVSMADGYPYLLVSEESLELLNQKLEKPVTIDRFRANIIIKGGKPHIEDDFQEYQINTAVFRAVKPCARCQVITTDQQTAEVGKEPLKTLATYRKVGNKVLFGQNLIFMEEDGMSISIGDSVEARMEKEPIFK